jgi:hypothetical protein
MTKHKDEGNQEIDEAKAGEALEDQSGNKKDKKSKDEFESVEPKPKAISPLECPHDHTALLPDDLYCPKCGTRVSQETIAKSKV